MALLIFLSAAAGTGLRCGQPWVYPVWLGRVLPRVAARLVSRGVGCVAGCGWSAACPPCNNLHGPLCGLSLLHPLDIFLTGHLDAIELFNNVFLHPTGEVIKQTKRLFSYTLAGGFSGRSRADQSLL